VLDWDNRRTFFRHIAQLGTLVFTLGARASRATLAYPSSLGQRLQQALKIRQGTAAFQSAYPAGDQTTNGDESLYPNLVGTFTKALPHNALGEVDLNAYGTFIQAMQSGRHADFENITIGYGRKLVNPQGAYAYALEGNDPVNSSLPPPPALSSAEAAADMVELYWQAAARDIAFSDYATSPVIQRAAAELSALRGYSGPRDVNGQVTPGTIFRGPGAGNLIGPYVSQYLLKPVPFFSGLMEQQYRTGMPAVDYVKVYSEWLDTQSGIAPYNSEYFDSTPRYLRNGRDLAQAVHYDHTYQFYTQAALIILDIRPETLLDATPPSARPLYVLSDTNPYKRSRIQTGFVTFGPAHVCSWLGNVTAAALRACWFQKWCLHRRLRPDTFGGRVHNVLTGAAAYPIHPDLMQSEAVQLTVRQNGSALLSQAYLESSPIHPSYPAGHAAIGGACVSVLKALFNEDAVVPSCYVPASDGLSLIPADGLGLTLGNELDKMAFNIGMGRDFAGIHYRSDVLAGLQLGEAVATAFLQDQVNTFTEEFPGFHFTGFSGNKVTILPNLS